jgi:hypothetical protein
MSDLELKSDKEVFVALINGKKIRERYFTPLYYFHLDEDGNLKDSLGIRRDLDNIGACFNWELYEEPKKKKTIEMKFYRYHFLHSKNHVLSNWTTEHWSSYRQNIPSARVSLLKKEERIETYEVDDDQK